MPDLKHIAAYEMVDAGEYFCLCNFVLNDVVLLDKRTLQIQDCISLETTNMVPKWQPKYCSHVAYYDGNIFVFPYFWKDNMFRISLETREIKGWQMSELAGIDGFVVPYKYVQIGHELYFIKDRFDGRILVFDMRRSEFTEKVMYHPEGLLDCDVNSKIGIGDIAVYEDEIYWEMDGCKGLCSLSLQSGEIRKYATEDRLVHPRSLGDYSVTKNTIWYQGSNCLCALDKLSGACRRYPLNLDNQQWKLVAEEEKVYLISQNIENPNLVYVFYVDTEELLALKMDYCKLSRIQDFRMDGDYNYYQELNNKESIILCPEGVGQFLVIDRNTDAIQSVETVYSSKWEPYLSKKWDAYLKGGPIYEDGTFGLKEFCDFIKRQN